jgi:hypothetical protein
MVLQKVQRLCFIRFCALILASFRLGNNMIKAHAVEFDLDVNGPSKVVAAIHGKLIKFLLGTV